MYPTAKDDKRLSVYVAELRYRNKRFRNFIEKNGRKVEALTKRTVLANYTEIADFNVADLYELDKEGRVQLKEAWLDIAKAKNVLAKIKVMRRTSTDPKGNETVVEILDVVPYSRIQAMIRYCKLKGFDEGGPKGKTLTTTNNTFLVGQINSIRDSIRDSKVPVTALPEMDAKYLDTLVNAEIVKEADKESDGDGEGD